MPKDQDPITHGRIILPITLDLIHVQAVREAVALPTAQVTVVVPQVEVALLPEVVVVKINNLKKIG